MVEQILIEFRENMHKYKNVRIAVVNSYSADAFGHKFNPDLLI